MNWNSTIILINTQAVKVIFASSFTLKNRLPCGKVLSWRLLIPIIGKLTTCGFP